MKPNESGAEVRCPKCGSARTNRRLVDEQGVVDYFQCVDCGHGFKPIEKQLRLPACDRCGKWQGIIALKNGGHYCVYCREDVVATPEPASEAVPPEANPENANQILIGPETEVGSFDGHPIIKSALEDFGREVIASLQAQNDQLRADVLRLEKERDEAVKWISEEYPKIAQELSSQRDRLRADLAAARKDVAAFIAELKLAQNALKILAQQNHRTATAYFSDLAMEQGRTKFV